MGSEILSTVKVTLSELQTIWPTVAEVRTRLVSSTCNTFSFLRRRESESSSSLSSSLNSTTSTMQNCWSPEQSDVYVENSTGQQHFTPCEFCFEPSNPVIMSEIFNATRERQCSAPVPVPDCLAGALINSHKQPAPSQSSGYESPYGNELSSTMNYWRAGDDELSSCPSIISDDILNDQDQSVFGDSSTTDGPNEQESDDDSFEVLSFEAPAENTVYIKEFPYSTLDSQNNACHCCNTVFTSISNLPPRRCYYYGKLYCPRCHIMDQAYIPAKIIKSFDMHLYPVCRRAKSILQLNSFQPIFDIQNDNENLYTTVPILSEIKSIRLQFQHYYAYLSTCTRIEKDLDDNFFKGFYARDYLYQSVHLYSINDLLSLKQILQILNNASIRAKQHIHQCITCREKGFTCEICKKRKDVLYPFDETKSIGQCGRCSNIYHKLCWENIEHDCPKCYRLIQRRHEQNEI